MAIFRWIYRRFVPKSKGSKEEQQAVRNDHEELVNVISHGFSVHRDHIRQMHHRVSQLEKRPPHVIKERILQPQHIKVQDTEQIAEVENLLYSEISKIDSNMKRLESKIDSIRSERSTAHLADEVHHLYKRIDKMENKTPAITPDNKIRSVEEELGRIKKDISENAKNITKETDIKKNYIDRIAKEAIKAATPIAQTPGDMTIEDLTDAQKKALVIIIALSGESEIGKAANEDIIKEMYPQHKVDDRRSTVANYIRELEKKSLVKREKKGRKTFISATGEAHKLMEKHRKMKTHRKKTVKKEAS